MRHEAFVDHVLHNFAWCVERACLLARRLLRFGVVGRKEILEDLAEEFGVERHFLVVRCVFLHREAVALQDVNDATCRNVLFLFVGIPLAEVYAATGFFAEEEPVGEEERCKRLFAF